MPGAASSALQPCFAALRQVRISARAFFSHWPVPVSRSEQQGHSQPSLASSSVPQLNTERKGSAATQGYQPSETLGDFYLRLFTETRLLLCLV